MFEAIKTSKKNDDYLLGELYFRLAEKYLFSGYYDSAELYYPLSLSPLELAGDSTLLGQAYIGLGYTQYVRGNYNQSMNSNLKAEKIFRNSNNNKLLGRALKRMSGIFYSMKDFDAAEKYLTEALEIAEKELDTLNIVRALNSYSPILQSKSEFDKVDPIMERAIALADKINCIRCMAISYSEWGLSLKHQGKYEEAISKYQREYELNELTGITFDQFFVHNNVGSAYLKMGKLAEALAHSDTALSLALNENAPQFILDTYDLRYQIYKAREQYQAALLSLELAKEYQDTLFNKEKARIQEDLKVAYETEKKEQQITSLEQENTIKALEAEQSKQFRLYLIIVVILLMAAGGVLYSRYRLKQRTAQLLDAKNADLQSLNQTKDKLFAIISHDLKSPLSSFHTVTSTLNQYYDQIGPDDIRKYLQKLENAAKSLEEQLKNLLEWSVNQIAERRLSTETVDLQEMAESLKSFFQLNLDVKRLNLYIQMDGPLVVTTDRDYLLTVLRNLISNAIKFTPPEGTIWLKGKVEGGALVLEVEDSGIGIAKEDFEKLFTLTADKKSIGSSPEKGTGLGLVLVKEMMDRLGGTIELQSQPGAGTSFTLRLSRHTAEKAA